MEVLNYPYNDLARFIRNTLLQKEDSDWLLPPWLFVLNLFVIVSVLLLLMINYFCWKVQEADDELARYLLQDRNARNVPSNKPIRRSVGSHCHT